MSSTPRSTASIALRFVAWVVLAAGPFGPGPARAQPAAAQGAAPSTPSEATLIEAVRSVEAGHGANAAELVNPLFDLGQFYSRARRARDAVVVWERLVPLCETVYGAEALEVATVLSWLASDYEEAGRSVQALTTYQRLIVVREKRLGPDHLDVATALNNMGRFLHERGQYAAALAALERSRGIVEKERGAEHPDVATLISNIAGIYGDLGRYAEALPLQERALAIREKALGPDDMDVARSLNNLAELHGEMGHTAEGLPLHLRSLAIREKALGPEHPAVATSLNNLGLAYQKLDRYAEAMPYLQRALAIREKALGPRHALLALSVNNLGTLYYEKGDYEGAVPLFQRALTMREEVLGPQHPAVATTLGNLGGVLRRLGRYPEAFANYERALAIEEKVFGPEHPNVATTLNYLAGLNRELGQYGDALPRYQRSLAIREKRLGPEHPEVANSLNNIALVYESIGDWRTALPLYRRALAISMKVHGREHSDVAVRLTNMAALFERAGQHEDARVIQQRALEIYEKVGGAEHPNVATALQSLAVIVQSLGRLDEAQALLQRSLAIREKLYGRSHPEVALALNNLGSLHWQQGRETDALLAWGRAWPVAARGDSPELAWRIASWLGGVHAAKGRTELAIYWRKQAVNILQGLRAGLANLDPSLQKSFLQDNRAVYAQLADLLVDAGRLAEAEQVLALLKDQELFELVRGDAPRPRADLVGAEKKAAAEQDALVREGVARATELDALERRLRTDKSLQPADEARRQKLQDETDEWNRRFQQWTASLAKAFATDPAAAKAQREAAERESTRLQTLVMKDEGGAIGLHYIVTDERLSIIVATPYASFGKHVDVKGAEINRQVEALRQSLQNRQGDPRPAAQALYKTLIEPVAAELDAAQARTLVLSLTGTLRYIPFGALHDGKRWLIERFAVSQVIMGTDHKVEASRAPWRVAGLGMTQAVESFVALPGVKRELEGIVRTDTSAGGALPGSIRLDGKFDRAALEQSLRGEFRAVHIGSHFVFRPGDESKSFLLLGDGSKFSLGRLSKLNFSDVELLTLSACDTATGGGANEFGAEVEGLATAVTRRGAQSVLATLWPVADPSTAQLMQSFYQARAGATAMPRAMALQAAQRALLDGGAAAAAATPLVERSARPDGAPMTRAQPAASDPARPYAHPYYWAPFVLMGNWL